MNLQRIEELIGKYERAETTLEEENQLKIFFRNEVVPAHLQDYKEIFSGYYTLTDERFTSNDFDDKILSLIGDQKIIPISRIRKKNIYVLTTLAAGIIILLGIYFRFGINFSSISDTYDDPQLAYAETRKVLLKVSATMNAGLTELNRVSEFNNGLTELNNLSAFEAGMNNMKKISILDKTKEILTTKN
jgi:hypothetical protein